jgi:8-oxo-dGTP pyrophosphatase MutT (NUDIX family)
MNHAVRSTLKRELQVYAASASVKQAAQAQRIIHFVDTNLTPWRRTTLSGHLTASAWITDAANERALLLHHKKLNKWLQPGGHVDDTDEAHEETSLTDLHFADPRGKPIFDVDVHSIPARGDEPAHVHYDIRFHLVASNDSVTLNVDESNALRWFTQRDIAADSHFDSSIRRMAVLGQVAAMAPNISSG